MAGYSLTYHFNSDNLMSTDELGKHAKEFSSLIVKSSRSTASQRRVLALQVQSNVVRILEGHPVSVIECSGHALNLFKNPANEISSSEDCREDAVLDLPSTPLQLAVVIDVPIHHQAGKVLSLLKVGLATKPWVSGPFRHLNCAKHGPKLQFTAKGGRVVTLFTTSKERLSHEPFGYGNPQLELLLSGVLQPLVLFTKQLLHHNSVAITNDGDLVLSICGKFLQSQSATTQEASVTSDSAVGAQVLDFLEAYSHDGPALVSSGASLEEAAVLQSVFSHALSLLQSGVELKLILASRYYCLANSEAQHPNVYVPSEHLYVGNIDLKCTEQDVGRLVRGVLGETPNRIILHQNAPGFPQYAFIWCSSVQKAELGIKRLNNKSYFGRNLTSNFASQRPTKLSQKPKRSKARKLHQQRHKTISLQEKISSEQHLGPYHLTSFQTGIPEHFEMPQFCPPPAQDFRNGPDPYSFQSCENTPVGFLQPPAPFFQPLFQPLLQAPVLPISAASLHAAFSVKPFDEVQDLVSPSRGPPHPIAFMPFFSPPSQNKPFACDESIMVNKVDCDDGYAVCQSETSSGEAAPESKVWAHQTELNEVASALSEASLKSMLGIR